MKYTKLRHDVLTAVINAGFGALRRDRGLGNYSVGYYTPDSRKLSRRWLEGSALRALHQLYDAGLIIAPGPEGFGLVSVTPDGHQAKTDWDLQVSTHEKWIAQSNMVDGTMKLGELISQLMKMKEDLHDEGGEDVGVYLTLPDSKGSSSELCIKAVAVSGFQLDLDKPSRVFLMIEPLPG